MGKEDMGEAAIVGVEAAAGGVKLSTSLEVIIPSIPEPLLIKAKSIPLSEATRFAAGLANTRSPDLGAGDEGESMAAGGGGAAATGGGIAGAAAAGEGATGVAAGASDILLDPSSTKSLNLATSS